MEDAEPTLVDAIDSFLEQHGMSAIVFGRGALNDPHFVAQLRAGRRTWPETEAKVRRFMSEYRAQARAA
jgi:tRNA-dihydrouridine synthase